MGLQTGSGSSNVGLNSMKQETVKLNDNVKELFKCVSELQSELEKKISELDLKLEDMTKKNLVLDEKIRSLNLLCDQIING